MAWITIILSIIQALPALIKIIQEIVAILHKNHNPVAEARFHTILAEWHTHRDGHKLRDDLTALRNSL